ncbi:hypothetical protein GCM10010319_08690 [Streptomyces blastmyceticus]|uniref:Uncharacterized protein n=1 Tax=Streptomyces blastmyceticus TaxID=68180 RepID=A0ABN0WEX2_9ACTN
MVSEPFSSCASGAILYEVTGAVLSPVASVFAAAATSMLRAAAPMSPRRIFRLPGAFRLPGVHPAAWWVPHARRLRRALFPNPAPSRSI